MADKNKNNKPKILGSILAKNAVENAKKIILEERSGKQLGLKTRWKTANVAMRKYFRFGSVYLLAGLSGSGKSYLLNEIINDFFDVNGINKDFKSKFIVLYFCYEMSSTDEVIRTLGSKTKTSYNRILSSEWNSSTQSYDGLSEEELNEYFKTLDKIGNRPLFYFETAGKLDDLEATCDSYSKMYPNHKIVVTVDHSLLSEKEVESQADIDLMAQTGKTAIRLKKKGMMVFLLGQLNNAIESYNRISNPLYQYPIKSDIYAQGQLYNACDSVMVIHQPSMLKITHYGRKKIPTDKLIHWLVLKARHGKVGSIWLENNLDRGSIDELNVEEKIKKLKEIPRE